MKPIIESPSVKWVNGMAEKLYSKILIAIDFSEHCHLVAERGCALAKQNGATTFFLHVIDNIPIGRSVYGPIIPFEEDVVEKMTAAARRELEKWGEQFGIPPENRYLEVGKPKSEIVQFARKRGIDLIVIGSHTHSGLGVLGSTASYVVTHAPCDTLAVRLIED